MPNNEMNLQHFGEIATISVTLADGSQSHSEIIGTCSEMKPTVLFYFFVCAFSLLLLLLLQSVLIATNNQRLLPLANTFSETNLFRQIVAGAAAAAAHKYNPMEICFNVVWDCPECLMSVCARSTEICVISFSNEK